MKTILAICAMAALCSTALAVETETGFKPLLDGKDLNGWHSFKKTAPPSKGWMIEEGALTHKAKAGGGDLVSDGTFNDFDLRWEWKVAPGANSGLKYFISEDRPRAVGHEYQLIDDAKHPDARRGPKWQTASFYDVLAAHNIKTKPVGDWNESRVVVRGNHVEHWLNGDKVLEYDLGSPEVKEAVAKSKFKAIQGFGEKLRGHILLQDHGDEISFRNIRIKELN